ncbi:sulfite exporter TauE/SafE family protein [Pseudomonas sp. BCA14]|uniref:sulfite exporter TauE/SafE family protein n=1 Tax=unclassified Pseudomonas TaxID=196821 RepID=UPI00106E7B29|nr:MULTISPECIES: sulfite exporter TauE/SafE family protein [unclassified Pseudomonas]TFF13642.1 sulfite exporter TauE/SafE family protein [Pseudomonas sp. JMN1]TFF15675.1 sulfite exporter TauE/SafE family protein [Pseudomonas sp. BCA17]TFF32082.1 sulfite exporter TauE/SafE family protein [Pseudomonas sp. BCA14]TFF33035.1 sulfite exporter TauE/SafE family protein [Pseudomonas sp. BCA13]
MLLASVLGLLMGVVMGLTGAGGGILGVPALVLGLGLSMTQAAPVSLLAVGAAAAVGAVDGLRHGLVRYRAALLIAVLGGLFSPLGVFLAHQLPEHLLMGLFSGLMVLVAWRMLQREKNQTGPSDHGAASWGQKNCMLNQQTGRLAWTAKCSATLAALGAVTGAVSGLLGVGGGFLIVPAFKQLTDVQMRGIVATSLMVISLISLIGVGGAFHAGVRIEPLGWVFIGASVVGMLVGRRLCARVPARTLQVGFAGLCVLVAVGMLFKAVLTS